ncbi:flagellar biosynthetic protein FliO [Vibrio sp. SCSIO 43140]|uniref:flagellar biosynthetic protein FliO n=1 Tax=Vibrio sp. SCSIO 43140 TaxID=2819100 RepID=UPI002076582B|nr:flagellar biosynthetic protein FliO [Vibrio sp. SCSIO 43140]
MKLNRCLPLVMAAALYAIPSAVYAAAEVTPQGGSPFDLAATLGSLVLVIVIILGLAWVLKRMKVPSLVNQQGLKIVRQIPVGTKERIAIVQAGEEQFLVGITAQSIQLISKLEQPLDENEVSQPAFASQLSKIMKKQQND